MSSATATSAAEKIEWLVILPDNEGALERRLSVRPKHFEGLKTGLESGLWKMGGALLSEPPSGDSPLKFQGSCMIALASSKEEVLEALKKDVYAENDVWDFSKVCNIITAAITCGHELRSHDWGLMTDGCADPNLSFQMCI
ncbi:hypothetical protein NHQ30_008642 [Ciborinia camelliae]|nr:hypothetical protein NHQ30_008642 [Ciborinia camelliae]